MCVYIQKHVKSSIHTFIQSQTCHIKIGECVKLCVKKTMFILLQIMVILLLSM